MTHNALTHSLSALVLFALSMTILPSEQVARADITAEQVNTAIERGVKFLREQQKADGSYSDFAAPNGTVLFPNGITSLATLAMLNCG